MSAASDYLEREVEHDGIATDKMRAAASRFRAEIDALKGEARYATVRQYADALIEAIEDVALPDPGDLASEIEADYPHTLADWRRECREDRA